MNNCNAAVFTLVLAAVCLLLSNAAGAQTERTDSRVVRLKTMEEIAADYLADPQRCASDPGTTIRLGAGRSTPPGGGCVIGLSPFGFMVYGKNYRIGGQAYSVSTCCREFEGLDPVNDFSDRKLIGMWRQLVAAAEQGDAAAAASVNYIRGIGLYIAATHNGARIEHLREVPRPIDVRRRNDPVARGSYMAGRVRCAEKQNGCCSDVSRYSRSRCGSEEDQAAGMVHQGRRHRGASSAGGDSNRVGRPRRGHVRIRLRIRRSGLRCADLRQAQPWLVGRLHDVHGSGHHLVHKTTSERGSRLRSPKTRCQRSQSKVKGLLGAPVNPELGKSYTAYTKPMVLFGHSMGALDCMRAMALNFSDYQIEAEYDQFGAYKKTAGEAAGYNIVGIVALISHPWHPPLRVQPYHCAKSARCIWPISRETASPTAISLGASTAGPVFLAIKPTQDYLSSPGGHDRHLQRQAVRSQGDSPSARNT